MLVDFWAIIVFVIILVLFLILFILTKDDASTNKLRDSFASSDSDYMINSYIKSPYIRDGSKTIGEIIADDSLNNNFLRTEESFKYFFSGVKISTNNDVGGYTLYVNEGGNNLFKATYDLKNNDFESIALRSFIINSAPGSAANIGVQLQISSGNDPIPIKIVGSKVMVPRIDGKELEITIQITYAQEKLEIFE